MMSKAAMLGTTALVALSASAFAVPEVREHRALQASCWSGAFTEERCCDGDGGDSSCWGGEFTFSHCCPATKPAGRAGRGRGASDQSSSDQSASDTGFAAALAAAVTTDADGQHHLYFHATDAPTPTFLRCGEVDAAPYMPASLFEPANGLALAAYAEVTIRAYVNPNPLADGPLALGRCASIGYNSPGGGVQGISWFGRGSGLMGPVCAERCDCNFRGDGPDGLPACRDGADDPAKGEFCSLCGPSTACPGCTANTVVISLFYPGGPPPPAPTPPTPAPPPARVLYTCQNDQCVVSDRGLGMADCEAICVPASPTPPAPAPHAGNQLYFRYVNTFTTSGATTRCGEVDAAPRMPVALFEPSNKALLDAYIEVTIDNYRPLGGRGEHALDGQRLELGRCADVGYTTYTGNSGNADWAPEGMLETICQVQCNCRYHLGYCNGYEDGTARNGAVAGNYCSLCNWAPSNPGRAQVPYFNGPAQVFFFIRPFGKASAGGH